MICYRDRTFCSSDCINATCYRYLSDQDAQRAGQLNLPVAYSDFSMDCPDYTPEVENGES